MAIAYEMNGNRLWDDRQLVGFRVARLPWKHTGACVMLLLRYQCDVAFQFPSPQANNLMWHSSTNPLSSPPLLGNSLFVLPVISWAIAMHHKSYCHSSNKLSSISHLGQQSDVAFLYRLAIAYLCCHSSQKLLPFIPKPIAIHPIS
jgi:hypothetical protein